MTLVKAAQENDVVLVKKLIKDASLETKNKALQTLCKKGHIKIIKLFFENHKINHSHLLHANYYKNFEVVKYLIGKGLDINKEDHKNRTPLQIACFNGNLQIAKYLIENGADINKEDFKNRTPLYLATLIEHSDIVKLLIKNGADVNKASVNQETPLYEAAFFGNFKLVKLLIKNGADLNKTNINHESPLSVAIQNEYFEIVKLLIKNGVRINGRFDTRKTLYLSLIDKTCCEEDILKKSYSPRKKQIAHLLLMLDPMLFIDIQAGLFFDSSVNSYYSEVSTFRFEPKQKMLNDLKLKKLTDCFIQIK